MVVSDLGFERHAYGEYFGDGIAAERYEDRIVIYRDTLERDFGHDRELLARQVERPCGTSWPTISVGTRAASAGSVSRREPAHAADAQQGFFEFRVAVEAEAAPGEGEDRFVQVRRGPAGRRDVAAALAAEGVTAPDGQVDFRDRAEVAGQAVGCSPAARCRNAPSAGGRSPAVRPA